MLGKGLAVKIRNLFNPNAFRLHPDPVIPTRSPLVAASARQEPENIFPKMPQFPINIIAPRAEMYSCSGNEALTSPHN